MKKLFYISSLLLFCLLLYSCDTNGNSLETTVAEQTVTTEETTVAEETTDSLTSITPEETSIEETTIAETTEEETTAEETTNPLDNYDIYCTSNLYNHYTIGFSRASEAKYLKSPIKNSGIPLQDAIDAGYVEADYLDNIISIVTELHMEAAEKYVQAQKDDYDSLIWEEGVEIPEFEYMYELYDVKFAKEPYILYARDGSFVITGSVRYYYHDNWLYRNDLPDQLYISDLCFVDNTKNINDLNP